MKLSDYVADFVAQLGVRHVFLISGGAVAHLVDSVARHPGLQHICTQHEQGAGAAADGYSRISRNIGVAMVTSGPGATNLMTSVCNAYFDSIPVLFVSGQVATFRLKRNPRLRQKGFQETDVVSMFSSVTKYSVMLERAEDVRYEFEKAVHIARADRMGPVLIDIPDDLQRVDVDPATLRGYEPEVPAPAHESTDALIASLLDEVAVAQRPVIIAGAGIGLAGTERDLVGFAERFHIPMLFTWGGTDTVPADHPLNFGGVGVCGPRAGNFAVQNADLVIALGTRLSQMVTGGQQKLFAPTAKKVMVDLDREELGKFGPASFPLDLAIECELADFFQRVTRLASGAAPDRLSAWRQLIGEWSARYPICPLEYRELPERINSYVFITELAVASREDDIIFTDAGGNLSWTMQAFKTKRGQRVLSAWNHSPMGYSLPASIGAALASGRDVSCIIGDGGLMMCLQELATIKRHRLPIKIFIFNNHGHGIQKQTLETWLAGHYVAVDEPSGLCFPDYAKLSDAFGIPFATLDNQRDLARGLARVLETPGPVVCNVEILEDQKITPMLKFGAGLEDLEPRLSAEELAGIMSAVTTRV